MLAVHTSVQTHTNLKEGKKEKKTTKTLSPDQAAGQERSRDPGRGQLDSKFGMTDGCAGQDPHTTSPYPSTPPVSSARAGMRNANKLRADSATGSDHYSAGGVSWRLMRTTITRNILLSCFDPLPERAKIPPPPVVVSEGPETFTWPPARRDSSRRRSHVLRK